MNLNRFRTPPPTPLTPDSSKITSLQSIISHHYLNALTPPSYSSFNSKSFTKNSSNNYQKKANIARKTQIISLAKTLHNNSNLNPSSSSNKNNRGFSSSLSNENALTAKSLNDFRNGSSANFSSVSRISLNSITSKNGFVIEPMQEHKLHSRLLMPKYLIDEKNASMNCKTDVHNKIIGVAKYLIFLILIILLI